MLILRPVAGCGRFNKENKIIRQEINVFNLNGKI
jgi:hypothetical protein